METRLNNPWMNKLAHGAAQLREMARPAEERAQAAALEHALAAFSARYPEWEQYLFDAHFVRTAVTPMLKGIRRKSPALDAASITEAWAAQVAWSSAEMRQRHISALLPAAQYFVRDVRRGL